MLNFLFTMKINQRENTIKGCNQLKMQESLGTIECNAMVAQPSSIHIKTYPNTERTLLRNLVRLQYW